MPKAKSDQVITHRIELQETERATLEAALAGRFITNGVSAVGSVFQGIGSALAPFSRALGIIAGAYVANKTWDELKEGAARVGDDMKSRVENMLSEDGALVIERVSAWIAAKYAEGGWDAICPPDLEGKQELVMEFTAMKGLATAGLIEGHENPLGDDITVPDWFIDNVLIPFFETICGPDNVMARHENPVELWDDWYSVEQYGRDAYYYLQQTVSPTWTRILFGWA